MEEGSKGDYGGEKIQSSNTSKSLMETNEESIFEGAGDRVNNTNSNAEDEMFDMQAQLTAMESGATDIKAEDEPMNDDDDEDDEDDDDDVKIVLDKDTVDKGTTGATFNRNKPLFSRIGQSPSANRSTFAFSKPVQPGPNPNQPNSSAGTNVGGSGSTTNGMNLANLTSPTSTQFQVGVGIPLLPNGQTNVLELDIDQLEDKAWRKPGADITDYFNYGFTEETWKGYCQKQVQLRLEQSMQGKIKVYQSSEQKAVDMPDSDQANRNKKFNPNVVMKSQGGNTGTANNTQDYNDWSRPTIPEHTARRKHVRDQDDSVIQLLSGQGDDGGDDYSVGGGNDYSVNMSGGDHGSMRSGFPPGFPGIPGGMPPHMRGQDFPPHMRESGSGGVPPPYGRDNRDNRDRRGGSGYRDEPFFEDDRRRDDRYDERRERENKDRERDRDRDRSRVKKEGESSSSSRDRDRDREKRDKEKDIKDKDKSRDDDRKRRRN